MIYGVGTDLIEIRRVESVLRRFGDRFARRILCEPELRRFRAHKQPVAYLAKRFAAKEAFSKAVGTGFKHGVFFRDIGVVNLPSGAPTLALTAGAKAKLDALIPPGHAPHVHLTMTDDHPWAQAFVIIEALPIGGAE